MNVVFRVKQLHLKSFSTQASWLSTSFRGITTTSSTTTRLRIPSRVMSSSSATFSSHRFIDIGVNLTDPVFRGVHRGHRKHEDDLQSMLVRSTAAGVESMLITGGNLEESKQALTLAKQHGFYSTAGCHPTRSSEFQKHPEGANAYLANLDQFITTNTSGEGPSRIMAIGECGLDYDRLQFAPVETQKIGFRLQLSLAKKHHLPLFLHSRAAHADFVSILKAEGFGTDGGRAVGAKGGVAHSFTGTPQEAADLIEMGYHISINGCGLKTAENLEMVKTIPLDRLLLETDAPWCSITTTHASHAYLQNMPEELRLKFCIPALKPERFVLGKPVKGRNEPYSIGAVAWVVAQVKGVPFDEVVEAAWRNTIELFGFPETQATVQS